MDNEIIYLTLYFIAFIFSLYSFWFVASEEGFLRGHIFDSFILLSIPALVIAHFFGAISAVVFLLIFIWIYSKILHWSRKKLGDIFSIPIMSFLFISSFAQKNLFLVSFLGFGTALVIFLRKNKSFSKSSTKAIRLDSISKLHFSGALFNITLLWISLAVIIFMAKGSLLEIFFCVGLILVLLFLSFMEIKKSIPAKSGAKDLFSKIKFILIDKKEDLEEQEKTLKLEDAYKVAGRADDNADVLDDAQEDSLHEITMQSLNAVKKAKAQIQKALQRIGIGKYGVCEKCGKMIDPARLKAYPETTFCLECSGKK